MTISREEWANLREDVGYIRAKIEIIDKHEERISSLEKVKWGPLAAIAAFLGIHFGLS